MRSFVLLALAWSFLGLSSASPTKTEKSPTKRQFGRDPNSTSNVNSKQPATPIWPKKEESDAAYSINNETAYRGVIYIPDQFTYGQKQPVILVPGTGNTGHQTYAGTYEVFLNNVDFADPVILNIPNAMLNDGQENGEMVAYAINYISGISGNKNVSIITWSQGGMSAQWALKFWPSTRKIVSDFVGIAPDFDGTTWFLTQACNIIPCPPSAYQQFYKSNFSHALTSNGGNSAYVPTTTIFSKDDEIVQPNNGTDASSWLDDARKVGVTNNEVQAICDQQGDGAGGSWSHEGLLYNNLAVNLALDALKNPGPGQVARLGNVRDICKTANYPQAGAPQAWTVQQALWIAAANIVGAGPTGSRLNQTEPKLKPYAANQAAGRRLFSFF